MDLDEDIPDDSQISFFRRLLPIQIDCERGAIIVGNPYVQPVLVTEFAQASGIYAALKVIIDLLLAIRFDKLWRGIN